MYCAGPLFTDKERQEMEEIDQALAAAGFATFLPHRDGLEFLPVSAVLMGRGIDPAEANELWNRAIFAVDSYHVLAACDALVVNLNGRVPDEGAVAEASMAWCAGKVVVGYKADVRSLVGGMDNAMVSGLCDFTLAASPAGAARRVKELLAARDDAPAPVRADKYLELGKTIAAFQGAGDALEKIADAVLAFAGR